MTHKYIFLSLAHTYIHQLAVWGEKVIKCYKVNVHAVDACSCITMYILKYKPQFFQINCFPKNMPNHEMIH